MSLILIFHTGKFSAPRRGSMVTRWEVESDILVISVMLKGQETCVNKSSVMFSGAGGAHNLF